MSRPSLTRLSPLRLSLRTLSRTSSPRFKTRKEFLLTNNVLSSLVSNSRTVALLPTTTSKRRPLSTSSSDFVVVVRRERRRFTPPPRRSSTSTRRSNLPFFLTTKFPMMVPSLVLDVNVPPVVLVSSWPT